MLGRALSGIGRDHFTVATKFGSMPGKADGVGDGPRTVNNDPRYIPQACVASLRRLGVDVIDLYYMHRRDPAVPIEELGRRHGAPCRSRESPLSRFVGSFRDDPSRRERGASDQRVAKRIFVVGDAPNGELAVVLPVCRDLGIAFVPFSPLGRAFLTGTLDVETLSPRDFRRSLPRFQGEAIARNQRLVDALRDFFAETLGPKRDRSPWRGSSPKARPARPSCRSLAPVAPNSSGKTPPPADVRLSAEQIARTRRVVCSGGSVRRALS